MALKIAADIDTTGGPTNDLYIRIENIQINRTKKQVTAGVSLWMSKVDYDALRDKKNIFVPAAQVGGQIILYDGIEDALGKELTIPTFYTFPYKKEEEKVMKWCYKEIKKQMPQELQKFIEEQ